MADDYLLCPDCQDNLLRDDEYICPDCVRKRRRARDRMREALSQVGVMPTPAVPNDLEKLSKMSRDLHKQGRIITILFSLQILLIIILILLLKSN